MIILQSKKIVPEFFLCKNTLYTPQKNGNNLA